VLGIDLGASNTYIYLKDKGIIMRESSVAAIEYGSLNIAATGVDAKKILNRAPGSVTLAKPFQRGIMDFDIAVNMFRHYFHKLNTDIIRIRKPSVLCSISCEPRDEERAAVEDALMQAGCRAVKLIEKPVAAAIGANLKVHGTAAVMVADIGYCATETGIFADGTVVSARTTDTAGASFTAALAGYIRTKYNIYMTDAAVEQLKNTYGTVDPKREKGIAVIYGRNIFTGLPDSCKVTCAEIRGILSREVIKIAKTILMTLDGIPDEYVENVFDSGITLTGGSAMLDGIDTLLTEYTGITVSTRVNPIDGISDGLGLLIDNEAV
jgi:rod shape-determining protein MreB